MDPQAELIHELRNDLNAMLASAKVLERGCTPEQSVFLQRILARGRAAAQRLEGWGAAPERSPCASDDRPV